MDDQDDVQERVMRFTAQHWPVRENRKLTSDTRLAQDLGMDGDDAVEFFKKFGDEFKVNLDDLYTRWKQHFGSEGAPLLASIVVILAIVAGFWLRDLFGVLPAWGWGVALIAISLLLYQRWRRRRTVPITVRDLIETARSGRWSTCQRG
jgi:hypothetical protein